jgi:uncharacterized protein (TIGR00369 family)
LRGVRVFGRVSDVTTPEDFAEPINAAHAGGWAGAMGIRLTRANRDEVVAEIEIGPQHLQPYGIVHGGVHAGIIETLASIGAALNVMPDGKSVVGLENSTSFLRAVRSGTLTARATPITWGRKSQVWEVSVRESSGKIVATGRVRLLVLDKDFEIAGELVDMGPARNG